MTGLLDGVKSETVQLMVYAGKATNVDVGDYRVRIQHNSSVRLQLPKE